MKKRNGLMTLMFPREYANGVGLLLAFRQDRSTTMGPMLGNGVIIIEVKRE